MTWQLAEASPRCDNQLYRTLVLLLIIAERLFSVKLRGGSGERTWNEAELNRIVGVLRDRKLNPSDPVFHRDTVLQTENWKLLIQSPLVAHLPVDLVWSLHESYYVSQQEVRNLRHRKPAKTVPPPTP